MPLKSADAKLIDKSIGIYATGAPVKVMSLNVRELKSAWSD